MSGCGCKNKNNGQQQAQPVQTQQQNNESVKNAVQKIKLMKHFLTQTQK